MKALIKVLLTEEYNYKDPLTTFVMCLYINYDFDRAQHSLRICEEVINNDPFIFMVKTEFMEAARASIFANYSRLHSCLSLEILAKRLGVDITAAEKWITTLIPELDIKAEVDLLRSCVVLKSVHNSLFDQTM